MAIKKPTSGWNLQRISTQSRQDAAGGVPCPLWHLTKCIGAQDPRDPATRVGEIIHGKRSITPDTARRIARFFGNSPEFWLNLQQMHDLSKAKLELSKTIEIERDVDTFAAA